MLDEEEEDNNTRTSSDSGDGDDAMQSVLEDIGENIGEDIGASVARLVNATHGMSMRMSHRIGATLARLENATHGASSSTRTSTAATAYGGRAVSASRRRERGEREEGEERESSGMEDAFDGTDGDESDDDEGGEGDGDEGREGLGEDYGEESGREDWGRYAPGRGRARETKELWNSSDITLAGFVAKCFPKEKQARALAEEGNGYLQQGKLNSARDAYHKALTIQPRSHLTLANLCLAYLSPQRAATIDNSNANAKPRKGAGQGRALSRTDAEAALKCARRVVRLVPSWPKGQYRLGQALEANGHLVAAAAAFYASARLSASAPVLKEASVTSAKACAVNAAMAALERVGRSVCAKDLKDLKGARARARDGTSRASRAQEAMASLRETVRGVWRALGRGEGEGGRGEGCPALGKISSVCGSDDLRDGDGEGAGGAVLEEEEEEDLRKCIHALRDEDGIKCQVCYELLCVPVTTPCGHSFCLSCLERLLDHGSVCPICRRDLSTFRRRWHYMPNAALSAIIARSFPAEVAARIQEIKTIANDPVGSAGRGSLRQDEMGQGGRERPSEWLAVFVCMVAWPTLPCRLHIFEPRYRLMMRRVNQTSRVFGMCAPSSSDGYSRYGTLMALDNMTLLPDGRALVSCHGVAPLRILDRAVYDDYNIALVERLSDNLIAACPPAPVVAAVAAETSATGLLQAFRQLLSRLVLGPFSPEVRKIFLFFATCLHRIMIICGMDGLVRT
jgi:tetratricopeptide (TPR) repeat protein